ncbi:MAG: hypothetical protein NVS2B12_08110 [Ktedonobacteraceae bacterium]
MHGLIFVTWEKFLARQFGASLLERYRSAVGETITTTPLIDRVYDDEILLAGVGAATKLTGLSVEKLLHGYGRYFILNELTSHRCAFLLTNVHSGHDLLGVMGSAHAQMRRVPDGLAPPIFKYETFASSPNKLGLIYDSSRQLCPLLWGAIEGAAERYEERVQIAETMCMKKGATYCYFDITFFPSKRKETQQESPEQKRRKQIQHQLDQLVLTQLPNTNGVTLSELQSLLSRNINTTTTQCRPSRLLEALQHLQHAGLVASTANQPGDTLASRRYWCVPRIEQALKV